MPLRVPPARMVWLPQLRRGVAGTATYPVSAVAAISWYANSISIGVCFGRHCVGQIDTAWPSEEYRCLRRVNGRIESTMWTVESPDATNYYARLRDQATDTDSDTGTAATDDGTAVTSDTANAAQPTNASAAPDADTDAELSPFIQQLLTDVQQGLTPAIVGL